MRLSSNAALVPEPAGIVADDDPALLDRGPGQEAALRIGDGGVALVGRHVGERRADPLAPQNRLAGGTAGAEVLRPGDLGAEAPDELRVRREAVEGEDRLAGPNLDRLASGLDDGAAHDPVLDDQRAGTVADRDRDAAPLGRRHEVVDEILAAARDRGV